MNALATLRTEAHPSFDPDFQRIPAGERSEVLALWAVMERVAAASKVSPALQSVAASGRWTFSTLRTKFYAWKASRDWRVLADKRIAKAARTDAAERICIQNPEFRDFLAKYVLANGRSAKRAFVAFLRDWRAGVKFPVYGTWKDHWMRTHPGIALPAKCPGHRADLPAGWSQRNLFRAIPTRAARKLAAQGFAAAVERQIYVARDVSKLRPMELLTMDDFRLDVLCKTTHDMVIDGRKFEAGIWPVVGIAVMDVATRQVLSIGYKPAAKDDDGKRMALTRADMAFHLATVFGRYGLPDYPVTLLMENASATLTADMEKTVGLLFGDRIRIEHTGLWNDALIAGGWRETGGKPQQKGWIEAYFSLLHAAVAALPGQMGARYDLAPGDLPSKIRYAENMIGEAIATGDIEAAARLRLPFLEFAELTEAVDAASKLLNLRTDHDLKSHRHVTEYRFPGGHVWYSEKQILGFDRHDLMRLETERRKESPEERWRDLCRGVKFAPVPPEALAPLMGEPRLRNKPPARGAIRFTHRDEDFVFFHADCPPEIFREDRRYTVHWHESAPDVCYLYEPDTMAFVAAVPRFGAVNPLDRAAAAPVAEQVRIARNRLLGEHRRIHAGEAERIAADREHNARVINRARAGRVAIESATGDESDSHETMTETLPAISKKRRL